MTKKAFSLSLSHALATDFRHRGLLYVPCPLLAGYAQKKSRKTLGVCGTLIFHVRKFILPE